MQETFAFQTGGYVLHPSALMMPDLKVCVHLGSTMLSGNMQAAPTHEKPSPDTAQHDQTRQMRQEPCHGHVI